MGRRNKAYHKDLHQQAYDRLTGMQAFGESKKQAVADGTEKDKIFSFSTYKAYWKHVKYFTKYIQEKHPECTTLKSAKKYVNEWLQARTDQGLSAWTIQLEAKAMGKGAGGAAGERPGYQGADRGGDLPAGEPAAGGVDAGRHKAPGNAPGCSAVPGGILYSRPQRKGRQGASKPHYRPGFGADHRADAEHTRRGKGVAARPPERRHSRLSGGVCHGHV